jgi:diguanylate cyclase (GGDEF)-like protein
VADGAPGAILTDRNLPIRANLIHEHLHEHGAVAHSHPHETADGHHPDDTEGATTPAIEAHPEQTGVDEAGPPSPLVRPRPDGESPHFQGDAGILLKRQNGGAMQSRHSEMESGRSTHLSADEADVPTMHAARSTGDLLLDSDAERAARERLFDEVLASVELVLVADGAAFWREEPDHSLVLTASRSISTEVLEAFDRNVTGPLQSIMQRWPESPLVAVPLNDPTNPIAEEIRQITDREEIVGLAGVPCRVPGEMLGVLLVVHRRPHPWTVRDLGLATGLAGQLATAMQNARLYASVRSLANRLAAIHELSLRLNQLRDVAAIGEAIVAEVGRLVDCDTVRVYRLDDQGVFRPVAASGTFLGIKSPPLEALVSGHGETLPGWVAKRNEALIIPDASVERRSIFRSSFGPESLLLVPMSYGESVQGVLVVSKEGIDKYGPDDEQALSIFGGYAAQAIVNADNIDELERQHALLANQVAAERRLLDVSEQLVSTLDPRRVLEQIAETIGSVVHYDRLTIYRRDSATGAIESVLARAGSSAAESEVLPAGGSPDEGLTSWVIGRGDAVCANDVRDDVLAVGPDAAGADVVGDTQAPGSEARRPRPKHSAKEPAITRNTIVVPLRVHGEVVGSLNLTRVGGVEAHFSEHEFELGKLFASQASIALQNAETHVTVSSRADLDALTSLRNHGTFQRDLAAMVETGQPFSLLMMDLDSFKSFNDTFGHPAGDTLLQTVARAIVSATRQNDRAYRYGGDEFALLLFGARRAAAEEVAGRVRAAVREGVQNSSVGGFGVQVSASVGAAHWPADGRSHSALVEAADAALYRAKRQRGETVAHDAAATRSKQGVAPSAGWLVAARDLISADTIEAASAAMVRGAAALCGTSDCFVLVVEDASRAARPVLAVVGGGPSRHGPARDARGLTRAAASGKYIAAPATVTPGDGLWGRILETGMPGTDEDGEGVRIGAPLLVEGSVVGVLGVSLPAGITPSAGCSGEVALVADLGAAALARIGSHLG